MPDSYKLDKGHSDTLNPQHLNVQICCIPSNGGRWDTLRLGRTL